MAFSMSEHMRKKTKETSAPGTSVPRGTGFSMSKYVAGTAQNPTSISGAIAERRNEFYNASRRSVNDSRYNNFTQKPNDVSDFDFSGNDLALDNTTDYNRLAELKIAADREAESNKYAVAALGGGGKSTSAKTAYETYLAEHTIPSEQKKVYTSEDSLVYQMLKDRAEAEKRQQSLPGTQRVQGLDPSKMGSLSGFADAFKSVSGTPAQDAFDDFRRRNIDYSSYLNAADFEEYSKKGAEIQNPTFEEAQGGANIFGWRPGAADVGNIVTFSRDNLDKIQERMESDDRSQFVGNALYGEMTEDQVKIYNYILAKEGKEAAQIYLDSIAETLNEKYGKKVAATVESTRGTVLHPIMVAGTATSAGLDQYIGGVKQAFNEYEQPTSGIQYAGQAVREDQGAIGKFAYDAISTLSNMAPSILANYVAVGLGVPAKAAEWVAAGSIGLGSGGNAYKQALAEGRSKEEAQNVAVLTGASEAVLSKLLSGISAVGGLAPQKLLPKVAAIEKGIWRVAAAAGIKIGGEISEEVLQLYLEPLYKTLIYGDQYDAPTAEEVAYTALLTLFTTGLAEGGEIAKYRTKEGAAEAVRAELQGDAQSEPVGVSESPNVVKQAQTENDPSASQTEQKKASTGPRDPITVITEENRKANTQQNEKTAAETQRNVFESNTEKKTPGFYSNDRFTGTNEEAQYLDRLAKAAGVSIEMSATKDGRNGWIVNGEAHLSENATDPLRVVAKHEITHHLKDAAGNSYDQFRNYVEEIYRSRGTLDQQIAAVQQLYRENGEELTRDGALDELAADYAGELLDNEPLIRKLAGENRNLAQRILDGIRDLIRRVKTAFGSAEVKQLDRAARLWETALQETNEAYQRGEVVRNANVKNAFADKKIPTYDELIVKPDVKIVDIRDSGGAYTKENRFVDSEKAKKQYEQPYYNKDTGEYVFIHKGSFTKSFSESGSDKAALAEHLGEIIENAILTHSDTSRKSPNDHTTGVYTLFSAVQTNSGVRPVRLKVKEYRMEGQDIPTNIKEYFSKHGESDPYASAYAGKVLVLEEIKKEEASSSASSTTEKSIADQYPSASSDISVRDLLALVNTEYQKYVPQERQSVKGSRDLQKQIDALERQNQRLKEQMKRTEVPKVRRDVVKRSAKDLRSMYSSKIDLDVLTDRIENVYNQLSARSGAGSLQDLNGVPTWDEIRTEMRSIADAILAESRANVNPMAEEYGEIRKELRGRKISISDDYRADLESAGGYEGIRKQNFGTFSLSKDGAPIDTVYDELNEKYPTLFPDDIVNPADQLIRLSNVLEDLKAVEGNPFENDLETTARYLAGEIEERFYDTPNQRPTLADKMASTYHKQRLKDQKELRAKLTNQKRNYEKQVEEIHEEYAKQNRQRIENQNAAQRRETIYRHATRLGKMLERPTNKRHVPEELRGAVLHMLRYINTESKYQLAYGADAKYHRVERGEVLGAEETGRTAAARALKAVYEDLLKDESLSIDPDIADYLEKLAKMGNKNLADMSRAELDTVWRVLQVVEHSITRSNELPGEGRYRTVEGMAKALRDSVGDKKDRANWAGAIGVVDQLLNRDMLAPETYFHVLGKVGDDVFRQMRRSADRQTRILKEGSDRAAKLLKESGVNFKKADKEHHTFHLDGGDLTLSTSQLMELYALNKRKQAMEHIYKGGLKSVGGVKGLKETGRSTPVKVTPDDVSTMLETLTDKQKALMDGLQAYLSGDLAAHGNEETLKVYGYAKFKEKNYWPIKVSSTETKSDPTSKANAKTIPGYGMTKELTPNASNSVELRSAIDTFSSHLNQMATYSAWLGTNEDVTRFHNFKFTDDNMSADGTVKELFERVYGKKGSAYLENLLSDIAQGTKTGAEKSPLEGMFGRWKAAKVGGNLRVVVQQPTAILRAMSMIEPKYLMTTKSPRYGWKQALKYSEIAQWKDWGYFEMDTGRSVRELITGTETNLDKAKEAFMAGAGAADSIAWGHLWNAVESETIAKHKELAKGSKEFYQAVADRFAEIIDRTQTVDSVLHRTQIMRSSSYAAKISTSFMSEPSKIYNMVARDVYDLKNASSEEAQKRAWKQMRKTTASLIVSFAVNALAQSLVDGLRDDDREKKYWERFADSFTDNFASNFSVVSYLPYFKDVASIIEGYTMKRSDLEGISDVVNAVAQLEKAISGDSKKSVLNAGLDAAARLGDLLGIPVSNLKRDATAIFKTILTEAGLQELQYKIDKKLYNPEKAKSVFVGDLYRAMDTDADAYHYIWDDLAAMKLEGVADSVENMMKKELGLNSVKNLPVRYSAPGEDPDFDALMREAAKENKEWYELLPDGSLELARDLDALGTDADKFQKVAEIGAADYDANIKYTALQIILSETEVERMTAAKNAGIKIDMWIDVYKAVASETFKRLGKYGSASQDDVEIALNKLGLSSAQKKTIWNSYGWKSESPW